MLVELHLLGPIQAGVRKEGDLGVLALRRLEDCLGGQPLVNVDRRRLDNDLVALLLLPGPDQLRRKMRVEAERVTRDGGDVLPRERRRRVVQPACVRVPVVADLLATRCDCRVLPLVSRNLPVGAGLSPARSGARSDRVRAPEFLPS